VCLNRGRLHYELRDLLHLPEETKSTNGICLQDKMAKM
jgi:hypothetical protein